MTPTDSLRLIGHLDNYARQHGNAVQIELCLDRASSKPGPLHESLRVLRAKYPQTGDDLLIDRFWFHHLTHHPCLVITNDEDIIMEVTQAKGTAMRVFDFVRRPGLHIPVFRAPDELPRMPVPPDEDETEHQLSLNTSVYFRIGEDSRLRNSFPPHRSSQRIAGTSASISPGLDWPASDEYIEPGEDKGEGMKAGEGMAAESKSSEAGNTAGVVCEEPMYFLDLDHWPLVEGARFLIHSFCPVHQTEYQDLIRMVDLKDYRPDDLRALAELLLHSCSTEENFAKRGSLMSRVRLALLQACGEPVSLTRLADATGLRRQGLQGRVKEKAGRWVGIILPSE